MTKSVPTKVRETESSAGETGVSPLIIGLIALCAGVTVSNLYLTQPLLPLLAEGLGTNPSQVGFLPTIGRSATRSGYS
jgi:predicted MFS family arabinose efflux permease